ncbi:MAG: hypothetical protein U5K81_05685 [Trueperaceae bacterium]|nr:hypothetical protein [Trueperaceae bacterium]
MHRPLRPFWLAGRLPSRRVLAVACLLAWAASAAAQDTRHDPIAAGGFERPRKLADVELERDVQVAVAPSQEGPLAVWQHADGLSLRRVAADAPAEPLVRARGVRAVWAASAGGDPVVAWAQRDLTTGRTEVRWSWRGETRTALRTGQVPRVRLVRGARTPRLIHAHVEDGTHRLALIDWAGDVRRSPPRPLRVGRVDALARGGTVWVAWLEGREEVALGRVERRWTALHARWDDGEARPASPTELGPARRAGDRDRVVLAPARSGGEGVEAAWTAPDGSVRRAGPGRPAETLGRGIPLLRSRDGWLWLREGRIRRHDGHAARTVVRLPAAPERIEAGRGGHVATVAWSAGSYLGGVEVWAVRDGGSFRPSMVERVATRMGWDPWRPWSDAGGHVLISLLAAVVIGMALLPLWWVGAALAARGPPTSPGRTALEGALVGVATVGALGALAAWRAEVDPVTMRALTGGWAVVAPAAAAAVLVAWAWGRRGDHDAMFGRLLTACLSGGVMLFVVAFMTLQAWLHTFGA